MLASADVRRGEISEIEIEEVTAGGETFDATDAELEKLYDDAREEFECAILGPED